MRGWQAVIADAAGASADGRRTVLAGDFNATLDHRDLRRLLARGYNDAADATVTGCADVSTARPLPADHDRPRDRAAGMACAAVTSHAVAVTDHRARDRRARAAGR